MLRVPVVDSSAVTPRLAQAKKKLEAEIRRENLSHKLEDRPDRDQLERYNILKVRQRWSGSVWDGCVLCDAT